MAEEAGYDPARACAPFVFETKAVAIIRLAPPLRMTEVSNLHGLTPQHLSRVRSLGRTST